MRASGSKSWHAHALALLLTLTALVHTRSAESQEPARLASVLIVTPSETNPLINEGVVRVRGELSALGLGTETQVEGKGPPSPASATQGRLVFERFGDWLRIQAWDPSLDPPVTQWVDTSDPSVNAEVLAVRAVEALRAALLPYLLRRAPDSKSATPAPPSAGTGALTSKGPGGDPSTRPPAGTPSRTTARKEPPLEKAPFTTRPLEEAPEVEEEVEEEPPDPTKPHHKPKRPGGGVWLGPAVGFDLSADVINYGAQAGFNYGGSWLLLGARFEITQATLPVSVGRIEIRRFGVMADVRARFALLERLDVYAALGGGVQLHRIEGVPSRESYEGATAGHTSLAFLAEVGGLHWFASRFALYLSARSLVSTNAPAATVDSRRAGTLNRPELAFSAGLVLGLN